MVQVKRDSHRNGTWGCWIHFSGRYHIRQGKIDGGLAACYNFYHSQPEDDRHSLNRLTKLVPIVSKMLGMITRRNSIPWLVWLARTYLEKRIIQFQDWLHLYPYAAWIKNFETSEPKVPAALMPGDSTVIVTVVVRGNDSQRLITRTLKSLFAQSNPNWRCWLDPLLIDLKVQHLPSDSRIVHQTGLIANAGVEELLREISPELGGRYVTVIQCGDVLDANYVAELSSGDHEIVYYDQDVLSAKGKRVRPFLKPDWSPELWLSVDILYGCAYNLKFLRAILSANPGVDHLLAAAVSEANKIEHLRRIFLHGVSHAWENEALLKEHEQCVTRYLTRRGISGLIVTRREQHSLRLEWELIPAKVSIVIPNRNQYRLLERCIHSILSSTDYPSYEVIVVDDHSQDEDVLALYQEMRSSQADFQVIQGIKPFNFSQACNTGARAASGDYVIFLNNDTEVIRPDWLTTLVRAASLSGVGAVGAKLLYPGQRVQHAGIVIGLEGHASHVFLNERNPGFTPYGYLDWMRNVSAVTAACMLISREAFDVVGGFDEQFQLVFNDVDLCLRLWDAGYRVVFHPDACLIHHEGKSRGKHIPSGDIGYKQQYFLEKIKAGDPYYHPGLSLSWRSPTLKRAWEQDSAARLENIIQYKTAERG